MISLKTKNTDNHTINSVLVWPINRFVGVAGLKLFDPEMGLLLIKSLKPRKAVSGFFHLLLMLNYVGDATNEKSLTNFWFVRLLMVGVAELNYHSTMFWLPNTWFISINRGNRIGNLCTDFLSCDKDIIFFETKK